MLSPDERASLRELLDEQARELLELTAGADIASLERATCLGALRLLAADAPPESAELFVAALEAQGPAAADVLDAIAALAPAAMASQARAASERLGIVATPPARLTATQAIALRLPGADVYLLRLDREGSAAWHAAHVIVEGEADEAVLAVAAMAGAESGGNLAQWAADLDPTGIAAIEPADLGEVRERLSLAALNAHRADRGLGLEATSCLPLIGAALGVAPEHVCGLPVGGAASSLVVDADDDEAFVAVTEALLDDFAQWLAERGSPVRPALVTADAMLTFKWTEGDAPAIRARSTVCCARWSPMASTSATRPPSRPGSPPTTPAPRPRESGSPGPRPGRAPPRPGGMRQRRRASATAAAERLLSCT